MATKGPPIIKGRKIKTKDNSNKQEEIIEENLESIIAQLVTTEGEVTGPPLSLPANDERLPYAFSVDGREIVETLYKDIIQGLKRSTEDVLKIVYQPQAIFKVRAVTRCRHSDAILSVSFSPDGTQLATGSGDTTVRIWDINTDTPCYTCSGHNSWVLCISWSPDGKSLASGSMDKTVHLWDPETGKPIDGTIRIWDTKLRRVLFTISQHTAAITCIKWGGNGLLYSASQGHGHWVNTMALSTDFVLRTGAIDHTGKKPKDENEAKEWALTRYKAATGNKPERLVSGSDDFTMFIWEPSESKKPIARLTGHQKLVNHVSFSPNGNMFASASFDNSVKLWDGLTGRFIASLRGHVGPVYQVCWSSDSRLLISASKDSTLKIWDLKTKKIKLDLPGHLDEVYSVDWSPSGEKVASGGKDRQLKM
ncbi:6138_t:CDS:10 [Diversispora eburnea]|uniref:6138_t:CDS:1 n=1 Tax=Diversispora eburnea TaxID=1213867 RepID=A0A9N8VQC9_9GLOM|nr:6138_t:CDS:10 [Diversispora eburnea]